MSNRYYVTDRKGNVQDIGATRVDFTALHVLFYKDDELFLALHADDVRDMAVEVDE